MIRKVVLIAVILSNTVFAGISFKSEKTAVAPPVLYVNSLNDGLDLDSLNINNTGKSANDGYELLQNLPVQFIDDSAVVWTIRVKDIVAYRFTEGKSKIIITVRGSAYREYAYIDLTITDGKYIKFLIDLFEVQKKSILKNIQY